MFRTSLTRSVRLFSTSHVARKTMTDSLKETGETVNKKVGETLAAGIDKGQKAAHATKETVGMKTEEAKESANAASATASHKASQAKTATKEAKDDVTREMKK